MPKRISKSKRKHLRGLDQVLEANTKRGLYDDELDGVPLRPVPTLTREQETFHSGITPEAFSLDRAMQMYANRVNPGAIDVVVHKYKDEAFEVEELERMEARDRVSDNELIARMRAAPDLGGSTLVALSKFVRRRRKK